MTTQQHIAGIIRDADSREEAARLIEEFLRPDYIPRVKADCPMASHGIGDMTDVADALPGMRCATITGEDAQSGLYYCGDPAAKYGWSKAHPEVCYSMCERHAKLYGII